MKSMKENKQNSYLFGNNANFIEELYELYLEDKNLVNVKWRKYFDSIQDNKEKDKLQFQIQDKFVNFSTNKPLYSSYSTEQLKLSTLIDKYRSIGVNFATLDPLQRSDIKDYGDLELKNNGLDGFLENDFLFSGKSLKLRNIIDILRQVYCGNISFEFMHIVDYIERDWLLNKVENEFLNYKPTNDNRINALQKLTEAEGLERFLNTKFPGQKRFSLEGGESFLPLLDSLIKIGTNFNIKNVIVGMAHRGRINTLVNMLGKKPQIMFDEFTGKYKNPDFAITGDVKYHKGYKCLYKVLEKEVNLTLAYNPSHLETINPIVNGMLRAVCNSSQDDSLAVLVHGDSSLSGLGTIQGTLNMSQTRAYKVNGNIHIVINNQVGFTNSDIRDNRSTRYCTDIIKMIDSPIIHVNADDVDNVLYAANLAIEYRIKFKKDIIIDLVCYRKYGHNEFDDPTLTQPFMYRKVKEHPGTRKIYADKLIKDKILDTTKVEQLFEEYKKGLENGIHINENNMVPQPFYSDEVIKKVKKSRSLTDIKTNISKKELKLLSEKIFLIPEGFTLHPTVKKLIDSRKEMLDNKIPVDYGMAETLAYGSLLNMGINVRITGEDTCRGTFSHRHAVWHDYNRQTLNDDGYIPLKNLENNSLFSIYDSVLNEECVMGFEYGYSAKNLNDLVIWEAQFGDFANGAQVIIDQYITSAEVKWGQLNNLVLLLPHGYDGDGPEHSSARLERFLQLSANDNIKIVIPSTSAQMFHVLRRQVLCFNCKPLIIFMSKKLLRFKEALSSIDSFTEGNFEIILKDNTKNLKSAKHIILCSGQIYYELQKIRVEKKRETQYAIIRIEELYPFPIDELKDILKKYSKIDSMTWVQDEPYNQGAWLMIRDNLEQLAKLLKISLDVISRERSSVTATGMAKMHQQELATLLASAIK